MSKFRILIVDDEDDVRAISRAALSPTYEVVEARDGLEALDRLDLIEPDFIILDVMMPMMDGFQACEAIRRNPRYQSISVLFLSALNSKEDLMKGYGAGANLFLTKPFDPARLLRNVEVFFQTNPVTYVRKRYTVEELSALEKKGADELAKAQAEQVSRHQRQALPAKENPVPGSRHSEQLMMQSRTSNTPSKARVLVVDDEPDILELAETALAAKYEVLFASDGLQAIERITTYQPDIVVMDTMMPKMSGYQLCQSLRRNARYAQTPIMFASAKASTKDQEYALRIGANAFLPKPYNAEEILRSVTELTKLPGFSIHPKGLTMNEILTLEQQKKRKLQARMEESQAAKQQNELENFLRQHR